MRKCSGRLAGLACALLALALMSPARSTAAAPASSLGPEVAVSKPRDGYVGRMDVSPDHGPAGTPVTVTAEGLPAGQEFQVVWVTANGAWKEGHVGPVYTTAMNATILQLDNGFLPIYQR